MESSRSRVAPDGLRKEGRVPVVALATQGRPGLDRAVAAADLPPVAAASARGQDKTQYPEGFWVLSPPGGPVHARPARPTHDPPAGNLLDPGLTSPKFGVPWGAWPSSSAGRSAVPEVGASLLALPLLPSPRSSPGPHRSPLSAADRPPDPGRSAQETDPAFRPISISDHPPIHRPIRDPHPGP